MRVRVLQEGLTVDHVVWLALGRQDDRLVERTLALNPGLAELGVFLPVGTDIVLAEVVTDAPLRASVKLFD